MKLPLTRSRRRRFGGGRPQGWSQTAPCGTRGTVFPPSAAPRVRRNPRSRKTARPAGAPDRPSGVPQGAVCDQLAEAPPLNRDRQRPGRRAKPRHRFGKLRPPVGQSPAGRLGKPFLPDGQPTGGLSEAPGQEKLGLRVGQHRLVTMVASNRDAWLSRLRHVSVSRRLGLAPRLRISASLRPPNVSRETFGDAGLALVRRLAHGAQARAGAWLRVRVRLRVGRLRWYAGLRKLVRACGS